MWHRNEVMFEDGALQVKSEVELSQVEAEGTHAEDVLTRGKGENKGNLEVSHQEVEVSQVEVTKIEVEVQVDGETGIRKVEAEYCQVEATHVEVVGAKKKALNKATTRVPGQYKKR